MGDSGSQIIKIFKVHFIFYRVIKKFHSKLLSVVSQKLYSLQYLNKLFLRNHLKNMRDAQFFKNYSGMYVSKKLRKTRF